VKQGSGNSNFRKLIIPEEEILQAITHHVSLDAIDEARSIYQEALLGNKVAEFIVGMALMKTDHKELGEAWLGLSADKGFEPAIEHLRKAG
jgi:hypothetical protein